MHYQIQWIKFHQRPNPVSIVLQYVNGPCPLIALCNVLFLRGKLFLSPDTREVSFEQLCQLLKVYLQQTVQTITTKTTDETRIANALQALEDSFKIMPTLEQGLDINVKFSDPLAYEFTTPLALFDLCGVRVVHGWCADPDDGETSRVIGSMSYNEVVNFLTIDFVPNETDTDEAKSEKLAKHIGEKTIAQTFLNETQSQLTIAGLAALHQVLADEELAVLFRNNHFAVLLKHNTRLYTLVSDSVFIAAAPYVTWSYLSDIGGDQLFLDSDFKIPHPQTVEYYARANGQRTSASPTPFIQPQQQQQQQPQSSPNMQQQPQSSPHPYPNSSPTTAAPSPSHPPPPMIYPIPATNPFVPNSPDPLSNVPVGIPLGTATNSQHTPIAVGVPVSSPSGAAAPLSSSSSSSLSASFQSLTLVSAEESFAAANGMRWNSATQNYEMLTPPPPTMSQQQHQQQHGNHSKSHHKDDGESKEKKRKTSCAIQ